MSENLTTSPIIDPSLATGNVPATFLGEGAQFRVYDMHNGHVLKVPQTLEDSVTAVTSWHKGSPEEIQQYAQTLVELRDKGTTYVRELIGQHPEAASFFGNPRFFDSGSFIQDRLTPLDSVLKTDSSEAFSTIDKYLDGVVKSWEYGCFDWVFNLAINTAVNDRGELVMMDFGEMGFDLDTLHGLIGQRTWEHSYDTTHRLHPKVREYFLDQAGKQLTKDRSTRHWRRRLTQ